MKQLHLYKLWFIKNTMDAVFCDTFCYWEPSWFQTSSAQKHWKLPLTTILSSETPLITKQQTSAILQIIISGWCRKPKSLVSSEETCITKQNKMHNGHAPSGSQKIAIFDQWCRAHGDPPMFKKQKKIFCIKTFWTCFAVGCLPPLPSAWNG